MKIGKTAFALAAVTVYIVCPAYRYYIIGSWIGYKIMNDKPRFRVVPKGSKTYNRLVGKPA
ncbi:hypothetical protein J2X61_006674 [Bacillus sp. 3255]|nr:hypothetical protein [Bacillus sp. 3255]